MKPAGTLLAAWTLCAALAAQAPSSFDAATVRPSGPDSATRRFMIQGRRFVTLKTSLADLIQFAYGLHPHQILNGPKWIESDKFDVVGATAGQVKPSEREYMAMMASLLTSRFQLRFHREKREMPVYALIVARGGPKLKLSESDPKAFPSLAFHGRGQLVATNSKLADLAWELQSAVLDRPVVDQTGLTSRFDFALTWAPDEFQKSNLTGGAPAADAVPPLFTAIQEQLGLRLEPARSSVEVMVIDGVAPPSED